MRKVSSCEFFLSKVISSRKSVEKFVLKVPPALGLNSMSITIVGKVTAAVAGTLNVEILQFKFRGSST